MHILKEDQKSDNTLLVVNSGDQILVFDLLKQQL
jgi:hypothetical protein